ncbi:MAG: tyrosine-type recombinase/integrase [Planctomycetota bacterium]
MSTTILENQYATAILAAGNKRSTFDAYWPHVQAFVAHTRSRRGRSITRRDIEADDVYAFRDHLARARNLSPAARNQAMSAVRFLFARVLRTDLVEHDGDALNAKTPSRRRRKSLPRKSILKFFDYLPREVRLMANLQYAGVMRIDDVVNLRWKDINFDDCQIAIASCKHDHFRIVPFPRSVHDAVRQQMNRVRTLHAMDIRHKRYGVSVPYAYARKSPSAPMDFGWWWVFPSRKYSIDPADGVFKRYRRHKDAVRKTYKQARRDAGILQTLTPHDLRRNAAKHLHYRGMPIKRLQDILGHARLEQTRAYILDDETQIDGTMSPFDDLMRCAG